MRKVLVYSLLLVAGLIGSQLPSAHGERVIHVLTMIALAFIMIHVGYEFEIDRRDLGRYGRDYLVAASAATLPWLLCAGWFLLAMIPPDQWQDPASWKQALLEGLFSAPTSAGVLFAMLAAAGLGATWVFAKARVLAIFDDLHTVLLLIPMKIMLIGLKWQLVIAAGIMVLLLWLAWRYLRKIPLPVSWPWVLGYSIALTGLCVGVSDVSSTINSEVPVQLEVLLPAFALGCMLKIPAGHDPHAADSAEGHEQGPESPAEQRVATIVSGCFMVLVGLSMPAVGATEDIGWGLIAANVLAITVLSNVGKLLPVFCYRREASFRQRLALAVGLFPRGEVGAGVLVIGLSYGMSGPLLTVAVLSLALNLLGTGVFILVVKRLLASDGALAFTAQTAR